MHATVHAHTAVATHMWPRALTCVFTGCFAFEAPTSPSAETDSWSQSSQCSQETDSSNLSALVCSFLNFTITFSLPRKILLPYENLLTSLLLTLVKQLLGGKKNTALQSVCTATNAIHSWHRHTNSNCSERIWKRFWNQYMCSKWLQRNMKAGKVYKSLALK